MEANVREIPILYSCKEECCGCTACVSVCPKGAISMEADKEGFLYPVVHSELCIKCYMCMEVCPFK